MSVVHVSETELHAKLEKCIAGERLLIEHEAIALAPESSTLG